MAENLEVPVEAQRFDEYVEIAVDGRPIFRVKQISELRLSDIDDAAIASFLNNLVENIDESLQEEYDQGFEEILADEQPDLMVSNSMSQDWEQVKDD